MVEAGDRAGFALEPAALLVIDPVGSQDLDRDLAAEPGVARAIDLAHAALAELGHDLVRSEVVALGEPHPPAS